MSTSGVAGQPASTGSDRGHSFGVWSLLMLPFLVVSAVAGAVAGLFVLGRAGLEGSEPMSEQGIDGWLALGLSTLIFMTPMIVGVFLGAKARKLGETRLGTIGMIVDGVILVGYSSLAFLGAITQ